MTAFANPETPPRSSPLSERAPRSLAPRPHGIRDAGDTEPSPEGRRELAMTLDRTHVLFFEPATYASRSGVKLAAEEIARHTRLGRRVVVVTAAAAERVAVAISEANALPVTGDDDAHVQVLARPHTEAAERLSVAVRELGVSAEVLDGVAFGPVTRGGRLDAEPRRLNITAIAEHLRTHAVVILPAGVGRTEAGDASVLGEGGEHLSAVFVADRLAAPVRFVREQGEHDYASVSHDDAVLSDGGIVSRRAALYARRRELRYEVGSTGRDRVTFVGDMPTTLRAPSNNRPITEHRVRVFDLDRRAAAPQRQLATQGC